MISVGVRVMVTMIVGVFVRYRRIIANTLYVMMVALLSQTNLLLKSKHLLSILAQLAIHIVFTSPNFFNPVYKSLKNHRVVT